MSETYMGEIRVFFGKDAPKDWLFCHGQIVPITSNTALFALLGTSYGGNGKTTFALPDFRKRAPVGTSVGIWTGAHDQHPISLPGSQETHVGPQYMIAVHNSLFPPGAMTNLIAKARGRNLRSQIVRSQTRERESSRKFHRVSQPE